MNSDSESLQNQLLLWLLAEHSSTEEDTSVECKENYGVENPLQQIAAPRSGDVESEWIPQSFQLGEIPTVQERFQSLLKRRLQTQIQKRPPLFPWETKLTEYPDYVDSPSVSLVPVWGWTAQQSKLNLPVDLPQKVFQQLLEKCQLLVTSSLPLGAKLVQAVEGIFEGESHTLNDLAGLVLRSPSRSTDSLTLMPLESSYLELQPRQQMALSLLAAKQLLENLHISVSPTNSVEKQWLTSAGLINLLVECQTQGKETKLRVQGELPCSGMLKLQADTTHAMAKSNSPGCLSVELSYTSLTQMTLQIELKDEQQPLLFVITPG